MIRFREIRIKPVKNHDGDNRNFGSLSTERSVFCALAAVRAHNKSYTCVQCCVVREVQSK